MPDHAQPRLFYLANNRLPTEKAHGLQIVQNCEALANAGYAVTLVTARRANTPEMARAGSLWDYYGVAPVFKFRQLPCLDLFRLVPPSRVPRVAFLAQTFSYLLVLLGWLLFHRADIYYTRDLFVGVLIAMLHPRRAAYEAHQIHRSRIGQNAQGFVARRSRTIAITGHIADEIAEQDVPRGEILVAHDGIRAARFDAVPAQADARRDIGWPADAFIVGWVGRLHLMGVDKGVDTLVDAIRQLDGVALALVGGPDDMVDDLRAQWQAAGLDPARFLASGHVRPQDVPRYLSAFDICAMPHPWTHYFAYYTSPIKLFEYMASRRAIVASDLPGFAEVLTHEQSALLVPPGDADALAAAITRLRDDPALREQLASRAYADVMAHYTWAQRAARIRRFMEEGAS